MKIKNIFLISKDFFVNGLSDKSVFSYVDFVYGNGIACIFILGVLALGSQYSNGGFLTRVVPIMLSVGVVFLVLDVVVLLTGLLFVIRSRFGKD